MAKARQGKSRGRGAAGGKAAERREATRELTVGRPLQARLIALEKQIGLFSEEQSFAADSRFNHPVVLRGNVALPETMAALFHTELAELKRLERPADGCHAADVGPYRVHGLSYFHYDGFKALLYVEHDGRFLAAWKEEEVLQPDSPRTFLAGVEDAEIERFLEHVRGV